MPTPTRIFCVVCKSHICHEVIDDRCTTLCQFEECKDRPTWCDMECDLCGKHACEDHAGYRENEDRICLECYQNMKTCPHCERPVTPDNQLDQKGEKCLECDLTEVDHLTGAFT